MDVTHSNKFRQWHGLHSIDVLKRSVLDSVTLSEPSFFRHIRAKDVFANGLIECSDSGRRKPVEV